MSGANILRPDTRTQSILHIVGSLDHLYRLNTSTIATKSSMQGFTVKSECGHYYSVCRLHGERGLGTQWSLFINP